MSDKADKLHKRLAKSGEMGNRVFLREVADALEGVMSTDPEMPSHEETMKEAERVLALLRERLA